MLIPTSIYYLNGTASQPLFIILMELHPTIYDDGLSCNVV